MGYLGYRIILFISLFVAFSAFFYYLRKNKVIGKKVKEVQNKLDVASIKRSRERKHSIGIRTPKSFIERLIEKPERRFIYSGIGNRFPGVTVEIWIILVLGSAAAVYLLAFWILGSFLKAVIVMGVYAGIIELFETFLILKNYRTVDDELLEFLNILANYNSINGEITSIFMQVSIYLKPPLKNELENCYFEAYTSGDSRAALEALSDKIEHPTFKDIIRNIMICINYSANYKEVVNSSRKIVRDEKRAREERKSIAREGFFNMLLLTVLSFLALYITDGIINKASIWNILLQTTLGHVSIVVMLICYFILMWKVWTVDR